MRDSRELTMKTIMFATDFSDASHGALFYAKQLAKSLSAKILVVHVVEAMQVASPAEQRRPNLAERMDSAEEQMERIIAALSSDGVRCAMIVRSGGIRETIQGLIHEREVDLLVIGTRGSDSKDQEGLGSVAETLLRAMPCPVLTVGKNVRLDAWENTHARSILFPTDFSEASHAALEYAERLTKHLAARILLLHVDENYASAQHAKCEDEFREFLKGLEDQSVNTECMVRVGPPTNTIIAVSKDNWVDFIVMGVHGTDQADTARNYGTAFDVICRARCPVLTVHVETESIHANSSNTTLQ